jgi:sporulation protein YpjB
VIRDEASSLEEAVKRKQTAAAASAFSRLQAHYGTIRPALRVSREPYQIEKADSILVFINKRLAPKAIAKEDTLQGIRTLQDTIDELFGGKEDKTAYLPIQSADRPIFWTFGIGSLIVCVLGFVAWRKFHAEPSRPNSRREQKEKP